MTFLVLGVVIIACNIGLMFINEALQTDRNESQNITDKMIKMLSSANIDTLDQYKKTNKDDLLLIKGVGEKMLNSIDEKIDNYLKDN